MTPFCRVVVEFDLDVRIAERDDHEAPAVPGGTLHVIDPPS
jgi:hypothetical protein